MKVLLDRFHPRRPLALALGADSMILRLSLFVLLAAGIWLLSATSAHALGMMIPKDKSIPPLSIKSHRVQVVIKDQGAETEVDQVFVNNTNRDLEATYLFPMPAGAATTDFALWINGKRVKGEVLDAGQAKQIYRQIVMRMKDPALLEYVGGNLFRASVYPVPRNGEQRVEIRYAQVVPYDAGLCNYVYPLRTDSASARTLEDFTVSVDVRSSIPIRSIYSPTHQVSVSREGDYRVRAGFEQSAALLDRDFSLFYTLSDKDVGVSILTHREDGQDGYFLLMVTPGADLQDDKVMPKDVVFVIDTSGSMQGEKMERAKEALAYCLRALRPDDRFSIVRFSDGIEPMSKTLLQAGKANVDKGLKFAAGLRAVGGTNINEALLSALDLPVGEGRPGIIVFLTDGQPTVGETDPAGIEKNVNRANANEWRLFSFGVGTSINTHLLDKLSQDNGGATSYVRPDAQIEREISSFFNKVEKPVLKDIAVSFGKTEIVDLFPRKMPDLFAGTQLVMLGRYKNASETAVVLDGWRRGNNVRVTQDLSFAKQEADNGFIKQLWATRKVGYLLGEIRLHGENRELTDEVARLGREYGIVTPFTSYLVTDPNDKRGHRFAADQVPPPPMPMAGATRGDLDSLGRGRGPAKESKAKVMSDRSVMSQSAGESAVSLSKNISSMKESERFEDESGQTRVAGGKTFVWSSGAYVDTQHKPANKVLNIRYGSDAYFDLLDLYPKAKAFLALGQSVTVSLKEGFSIVISNQGKEKLDNATLEAFLP